MNEILKPLQRILSNPSLVALLLFSLTLFFIFYFLGVWLLPVIVAVVLSYLLEGIIQQFERLGMRRVFALGFVFILFIAFLSYLAMVILPMIITQAKTLIANLPDYLSIGQAKLLLLPERFPQLFSEETIKTLLGSINHDISAYSKDLLSGKLFSSLLAITTVVIYIVLMPLLIFFFLKDKELILNWLARFLPENRQIITEVWQEVDIQIGNYIRGKFLEILVIWGMCFASFQLLGLQYTMLLSLMVGLSVLIPYVGATLVTIPVLVVAYMQFDLTSMFYWITLTYFIIQMLDGTVIVPLIFSEAVNIHPNAIIIAILVFGGLWGFWGVFFAIPLATLVKALLEAWRRYQARGNLQESSDILLSQNARHEEAGFPH